MTDAILAAYGEDIAARGGGGPVAVQETTGGVVHDDDRRVTAFEVTHPPCAAHSGLVFETGDRKIVISGDTSPAPSSPPTTSTPSDMLIDR